MKNYLEIAGISAVILFVGLFVFKPTVIVNPIMDVASKFGATSSLNQVDNPFTNIGGVQQWQETVPFMATSSFVFSIKNPFGATTTIERISMNGTSLIGTNPIYVSTSTTAFGTSTPALVAALAMASNAKFSFDWVRNTATTTGGNTGGATGNPDILPGVTWRGNNNGNAQGIGQSNYILGPTDFLNINIATSTAGTFVNYMTGSGVTVILRKI